MSTNATTNLNSGTPMRLARQYERIEIDNYERWGALVKMWVFGELNTPATLTELLEQCTKHDVTMTIPSYVTSVKFTQAPPDVLFIRLPPAELVRDTEEAIDAGAKYELPVFYAARFGCEPNLPEKKHKHEFHRERIGDYTVSLCV